MARGCEYDYGKKKYRDKKETRSKELIATALIALVLAGAYSLKDTGLISLDLGVGMINHSIDIRASKGYGTQLVDITTALCEDEENPLSEAEKYKVLYDFVVYVLDYNTESIQPGYKLRLGEGANDPAKALINGYGESGAYAELYKDLCDMAGLECYVVEGTAFTPGSKDRIEHAWNAVKIDGSWYHVDCSWPDAGGKRYEFFARGDNYIAIGENGSFREPHQYSIPFSSKDYKFSRSQLLDHFTINWK